MVSKNITFPNPNGETLSVRLDFPKVQEPVAFPPYAYCFTCTKHSKAAAHVSKLLTSKGITLLRFGFSTTNFSSTVADFITTADFMAKNQRVSKLLIDHSS